MTLGPLNNLPLEQRSIGLFLRLRAAEDGERSYLSCGGRTYTFAQTEQQCRALARGLKQRGIKEGSRVLMLLPNCAEFVWTWYACGSAAVDPMAGGGEC